MTTDYVGHEGLRRFEVLTYQVFDDVYQDAERRYSEDNGRTWTGWGTRTPKRTSSVWATTPARNLCPPAPPAAVTTRSPGSWSSPTAWPRSRAILRKIGLRGTNYHTFIRTSADNGRSWTEAGMIRYQDGPDYDPAKLRDPAFLGSNYAVFYYNTIPAPGGGVMFPADTSGGARVFTGRWDKGQGRYRWTAGGAGEHLAEASRAMSLSPGWPCWATGGSCWTCAARIMAPNRGLRGGTGTVSPATAARPGPSPRTGGTTTGSNSSRRRRWPRCCATRGRASFTGSATSAPVRPAATRRRYPFYIAEIDETGPSLQRDAYGD